MAEYETRYTLCKFLKVFHMPNVHWNSNSGWSMTKYYYVEVIVVIKKMVQVAYYMVVTVDKVTTIDNGSWLCIHIYVMQDYIRMFLLISLV